jgi:hypothetical protein
MPPGKTCTKAPAKVIERATAEACIAIARKIQDAQHLSGNEAGSSAARQVAKSIEQELLSHLQKDRA